MYKNTWKAYLDALFALFLLLLVSPLLLLACLAILLEDGRPIFFVHERMGRNQKPFHIFKFRSMRKDTLLKPSADNTDSQITKVGRITRRLNIDELPQLFNILRGDMSLIGPRPGLVSQTSLSNLRQKNGAMALQPGITGLAQVNSFDGMTDAQKAEWDGRYADNISLKMDVNIILQTFLYLLKPSPKY